ncbi:hypothetical protein GCD22_01818 [Acidithiobacillus thiooxidans ATCC 19377]|uniref:Uncharacterized protein n=1 Tax=Acidithiobacillus thiooxidans ATCC 19377 TaxID=637390 RepID=A0A5P9XQ15_ACITH|nr:hypothetical protein GCD22_01818 [Acidithiobacillus thiooxidans ATCC 19377]
MRPTYWHQFKAHGKLHILEFVLSTVLFGFFGELVTLFQYSTITLPFAVVAGCITVLFFVFQEYERSSRIFDYEQGRRTGWSQILRVDGKSYGSYTATQIKQTELAVLTDYGYVIHLFFAKMWWTLTKLFRFLGVIAIVMLVMAAYTWQVYPALVHSDITTWLHTGDAYPMDILLRQWAADGLIPAYILLWPTTFSPSLEPLGESLMRKEVAERLQGERCYKVRNMVDHEKLNIKIRYMPETFSAWDLQHLSDQTAAELEKWHPGIRQKLLAQRATASHESPY